MEDSGFENDFLTPIINGIHESGWFILYDSIQKPYRIHTYLNREGYNFQIFIWELTEFKGNIYFTKSNDLKIQDFEEPFDGKKLALGWLKSSNVFLGFDHTHYSIFEENHSISILNEVIDTACFYGICGYLTANGKSIFAFNPSLFMEYAIHLENFHSFGKSPKDLSYFNLMIRTAQRC